MVDFANYHKFAKVSSVKIACSILNNIINIQVRPRIYVTKCVFVVNLAKFAPMHQGFPLYGSYSFILYVRYCVYCKALKCTGGYALPSFSVKPTLMTANLKNAGLGTDLGTKSKENH